LPLKVHHSMRLKEYISRPKILCPPHQKSIDR
jgi:hypothetical protein